ncbi:DNA-3-methyladenine glycosylase [Ghiorsea bivora]|uniref:DNA-3-methyladenine glycosylase n=1 Tax=Ghiorsea bivora TaxID=1485545 RepID=UPI0029621182|nr:DNA-3-methyladenine glycosylase [Ghiorsea bivora]
MDFYLQQDVVHVAKDLLGKVLYTHIHGVICAGIITETEAYAGITDRASHAYGNRRTARTETMFQQGGISYVYLCYGMHHLFNVVTNQKDIPHAVLIRAIQPYAGLDTMLQRRGARQYHQQLLNGPGKLSQAMGINQSINAQSLQGEQVWLEDKSIDVPDACIEATPRIGVAYAKEDALLPYRFVVKTQLQP